MATLNLDALSDDQKALAEQIGDAAVAAGIDPDLAIAQAYQESGLNHYVGDGKERKVIKSDANAVGVMQMTPATAKAYGFSPEDLLDQDKNIQAYVSAMGEYLKKYDKPELAVMAYHQGEGPVDKLVKTNDFKYIGPKGKDYLLSIGANYDFNTRTGKFEYDNSFDPTEPLPSDLDKPPPSAKEPGVVSRIINDAGDFISKNPAATGVAVGVGTGMKQRELNKIAQQAPALEDQLRMQQMQQMQQGEELRKAQAATAGDKWSQKVVGSLGPGGESSTEAARNYRIQQGLQIAPDVENPLYQPNKAGVILPRGVQEQIDLQKQAELQRQVEEAMRKESVLAREARNAQMLRSGKDAAIKAVMSPLKSSLLTGGSTALAGVYAKEARDRELAGDELGSMISRVKAVGAGVGGLPISPRFVPGMVAKGLGYGTALGLEFGLEPLRDKYLPYRGVAKK